MKSARDCPEMESSLTAPLACFSWLDLETAGGKGANLGELVRAGFHVPDGFVITTQAYDEFVEINGLAELIAREQPDGTGEAIRRAFEAAQIPPEVGQAVRASYQELGEEAVAVRSSATAEDLPEAAFAGQQDTYLNVIGEPAVLDAVRRCWASLWTERAIAYRQRQGIGSPGVKLAVVVQRMVPAEAAGVMFTANPVTGERKEIWVDASPGLGEAVVSGLVTPDHYAIRREWGTWHIAERRLGKRELVIRPAVGGGTQQTAGAIEAQAVPDRVLRRLARLGASIQQHFGAPQDIEWAWSEGRIHILQARPMTALPGPPPRTSLPGRLLASNFVEIMPVRPYPLDLDVLIPAIGRAVEPVIHLLGFDWQLKDLFTQEDGVVSEYNQNLPHPTWKVLLAPIRLARLIRRYQPLDWRGDPLLEEGITLAHELEGIDLTSLSWEQLLGIVQTAGEVTFLTGGEIRRRYFPGAAFSAVRLRLLLSLMGRRDVFGLLMAGSENITLEMNRVFEELASQVRSTPALADAFANYSSKELLDILEQQPEGSTFLEAFQAFLEKYGNRETVISTSRLPAWKDDPETPLAVIKSLAAYPPQKLAVRPDWQIARDELLEQPLLQIPGLRFAFLKLLKQARELMPMREDTHFYATLVLPVFYRTLLEMGQRLAAAGAVESPEDIYYLRLAELVQVGGDSLAPDQVAELRAAATRRKAERARLEERPLVDPRLFPPQPSDGAALLSGMPGSPGKVEGPVRIVRDSSEFDRLAPGEVLVAPFTNPTWTPLFQRAAAVVVDSGSAASHAAIIAREYHIPAVMATMTGTQILHDGEWVQVDGDRGVVTRASSPEIGTTPSD